MSAKERVLAGIATINADPNIVNKGQAVEQFVQQNYPEQWEKMKQMAVDRANNPTQAESMQRMNSQQPPSGAFGGRPVPAVMQGQALQATDPRREIFRDLPNRRAMMPNQGGGQYVVTRTPEGVEFNTPSNPQVAPSNLPNPKTQEFNTFPPKIQRGQPGFMDYLEGAGRGLQSMGKGMSGYAEKLFNDPNRMAMLQGGLSMMNPNSYYDQQGFGSVFQGLETGLGQAQKGMKGVLDRRKAISDQALVDAKAKQERLGVGKEGVFPSMLTEFLNPNTAPERKKWLERRMKELAPGEGGSSKANQYIQKEMAKWMYGADGLEKARGTESSLKNFINILDSTIDSDDGIITGPMTDGKLWIGRFLSENLGAEFGDDSLENTQRYIANMGTMVGEIIKQFGSGTGLSDADREFARMISAQDPSQFTQGSLKGVLALNEMRMRADLLEYNDQIAEIKKMSEGTIPSHLTKKMPRMSKNLRDHIKMRVAEGTYGGINDDGVFEQKKPVGWVDKTKGEWESMMRRAPKTKGGSSGFKIKSVRPKQ